MSVYSRSNWNLKVLVFKERGKPEYPEKNLSEQGREPTTNSTHIWRRCQDSNLGHIGGRRVPSPLHHPCLLEIHKNTQNTTKFGRNLIITCLYNIFETYLSYWRYLLSVNLQIYLETSSLKRANNVAKLPGIDYVAKNWVGWPRC